MTMVMVMMLGSHKVYLVACMPSGAKGKTTTKRGREQSMKLSTYRNTVRVLLANALGLGLALLKGVLVLELAAHFGCWRG